METIYVFRVLGFLLVALGARSFGFTVASLALLSEAPLAFCGTFGIDRPRLTVHAVMDLGHVPTVVVALDVLPRLAPLTEDRITIVILEGTDALDSVRFILPGGHGVRDGTVRDGRVQRAGDRVRVRGGMRGCDDGGGICHNLTAYPLTRRDCRSSSAPSDRDASGHGASQPSRMLSSETCPQPPKQPFQPSDPRSTDDPVAARPSRMLCLQVSTLVRSPSATVIPYRRTVDGKTCRRTETGRSGKERSRVCVAFVTVVSINRMTSWIVWEAVAGSVS